MILGFICLHHFVVDYFWLAPVPFYCWVHCMAPDVVLEQWVWVTTVVANEIIWKIFIIWFEFMIMWLLWCPSLAYKTIFGLRLKSSIVLTFTCQFFIILWSRKRLWDEYRFKHAVHKVKWSFLHQEMDTTISLKMTLLQYDSNITLSWLHCEYTLDKSWRIFDNLFLHENKTIAI